jgi:hypothetical protein
LSSGSFVDALRGAEDLSAKGLTRQYSSHRPDFFKHAVNFLGVSDRRQTFRKGNRD